VRVADIMNGAMIPHALQMQVLVPAIRSILAGFGLLRQVYLRTRIAARTRMWWTPPTMDARKTQLDGRPN